MVKTDHGQQEQKKGDLLWCDRLYPGRRWWLRGTRYLVEEEVVTVVRFWICFECRINRFPSKRGEWGTKLLRGNWVLDVFWALGRSLGLILSALWSQQRVWAEAFPGCSGAVQTSVRRACGGRKGEGKEWRVLGVGLPFELLVAVKCSYLGGPSPLCTEQIETPPTSSIKWQLSLLKEFY